MKILRDKKLLLGGAILALAAALRAAYGFLPLPQGDGGSYQLIAGKILSGNYFFAVSEDSFVMLYRTPVYPAFLALASLLPGPDGWAAASLQRLLGAAGVWLIYRIGLMLWANRYAAAAGAAFAAGHFHLLYFESYLLSETLSVFLLAAMFLYALKLRAGAPRTADLLLGGSVAALAGLCRPELLLPAAFCVPLAGSWRAAAGREAARRTALYLLPVAMLCGAWALRNGLLYDYWGITPNSAIAFFDGPAGACLREGDASGDAVKRHAFLYSDVSGRANRGVSALKDEGISYQWSAPLIRRAALKAVLADPWCYLDGSLEQFRGLILAERPWPPADITETIPDLFRPGGGPGPDGFFRALGAADGLLESTLLGPLFTVGLLAAFIRRRSPGETALAASTLGLLAVYAFLTPMTPRYRVVAEPFMALVAAGALHRLTARRWPWAGSEPAEAPGLLPVGVTLPALACLFCAWAWFLHGVLLSYSQNRSLSSLPGAAQLLAADGGARPGKETLVRLGYLANSRHMPLKAERLLREALRKDPGDKMAADGLAEALFRTGRTGEALAELEKTFRVHPDAADVLYNIGRIKFLSGEKGAAAASLSAFLKKPDTPPAVRARARAMLEAVSR